MIEIDAATNRGIDEIRELRDAARYRPARDRYKIYILDEAHQITDAAFNALLKTLEEPPDHIVFMMATTQPEDIPQTIRSRCQHFSFHAVKLDDILSQLRRSPRKEEIDADDAALALLAEAGDGSMRDALSIMDQAIASAPMEDGKAELDARADPRADGHRAECCLRAHPGGYRRGPERRRDGGAQPAAQCRQQPVAACAAAGALPAQLPHGEVWAARIPSCCRSPATNARVPPAGALFSAKKTSPAFCR